LVQPMSTSRAKNSAIDSKMFFKSLRSCMGVHEFIKEERI
jgi:hypothetical protein